MVDEDLDAAHRLAFDCRRAGLAVKLAARHAQALALVQTWGADVLIVDERLAARISRDVLKDAQLGCGGVVAIVVTRAPTVEAAVRVMRLGYDDYLGKPLDLGRLRDLMATTPQRARAASGSPWDPAAQLDLAHVEWQHINAVLAACNGNITHAAVKLGLNRRSLQRKLRRSTRRVTAPPRRSAP